MGLDADAMLESIAATLGIDETIDVCVTYARRRTLVEHYRVTSKGYTYIRHSWGGYGTLRQEYASRALRVPEGPRSLNVSSLPPELVQSTLDGLNLPWRWAQGRYKRHRIVLRSRCDAVLARTALSGL